MNLNRFPFHSLALFVAGAVFPFSAARAQVAVILTPTQDTYVSDEYVTANYGDEENLFVHAGSVIKRTYLQFDLGSIPPESVTGAILRLSYGQLGSGDFLIDLHHVADDTWSEVGVTWSSMPSYSPTPLSTAATETGRADVDWNIPGSLFASDRDGTLSLMLKIQTELHGAGTASFLSSEATPPHDIPPQLILTVPEGKLTALVGSLALIVWIALRRTHPAFRHFSCDRWDR
jgi:hypothetical protein